ncbi:MAG: branched-chain amino acid ABC transporter permease [Promethearchaeota archaeon]|jgi:branched-chain amino acid transport system permease protein
MTRLNFVTKGHNIFPIIMGYIGAFVAITVLLNLSGINGIAISVPLFSIAGIFGIAALSLNLEVGLTGISNFGKIAFFMIGCYTSGMLYLLHYPFYIGILGAMIVGGAFGYLLALPTLHLREDYLAIVTIAVGEILRTALLAEVWLAWPQSTGTGQRSSGGSFGLSVDNIFRSLITTDLTIGTMVIEAPVVADFVFMVIISLLFLFVYLFLEYIYNSPWGRVLKSIRENELAAESLGKNVVAYRIKAFILASSLAGLAGGIWSLYIVSFTPSGFPPYYTFLMWMMIIIGGVANNRGTIVGSIAIWSADFLARQFREDIVAILNNIASFLNPIDGIPLVTNIQDLIRIDPIYGQQAFFGIFLILVLIFRSEGLLPERTIKTVATKITPSRPQEDISSKTDYDRK